MLQHIHCHIRKCGYKQLGNEVSIFQNGVVGRSICGGGGERIARRLSLKSIHIFLKESDL